MEEVINKELKKKLSFDLYGRYADIQRIIDCNRKEDCSFRVLDIGGRGNILKKFLLHDDVFYMDPFVESKDKNFISGDGCDIPLADNSFDWVTSADVFEHIPNEKKKAFLEENIRVSKSGIIIAAPFFSKEVERAEFTANENYKKFTSGNDHLWLKEHIEYGLPKEDYIENFLTENRLEFQKIHNNGLLLWEGLIGLSFFTEVINDKEINQEMRALHEFYNNKIYPFDSSEPSYRKIYFIKKDSNLLDVEQKEMEIDHSLLSEIINKTLNIMAMIYMRKNILLKQKDAEIDSYIIRLRAEKDLVKSLKKNNLKISSEVAAIKGSRSYKLFKKISKIKRHL